MPDKGTCTLTEETYGVIKKISFAWTSGTGADAGLVTKTTTKVYSGEIIRLVTVPGTAGNQPTDQYDITILDQDSTDVLMSAGANRSNVNTEQVLASSLGVVVDDTLTLSISAAGDTKQGSVYLYLR